MRAFWTSAPIGLLWLSALIASSASETEGTWSTPTNGLQVRLVLKEKGKEFGVRWIVPFLELRNVRDSAMPMEVLCFRTNVHFSVVDESGRQFGSPWANRSGPTPEIGKIVVPMDSSISMSMECRNWGVPTNAAAMLSTDSGAWPLGETNNGKLFVKATIADAKGNPWHKEWHGVVETPPVRIGWMTDTARAAQEAFEKIHLGMTRDVVYRILGPSHMGATLGLRNSSTEVWFQNGPTGATT